MSLDLRTNKIALTTNYALMGLCIIKQLVTPRWLVFFFLPPFKLTRSYAGSSVPMVCTSIWWCGIAQCDEVRRSSKMLEWCRYNLSSDWMDCVLIKCQ